MSHFPSFTRIEDSNFEDWQNIRHAFVEMAESLPDRVLTHLQLLDGDFGGFPVDRLTHSLQSATLAQEDGRDEEYVACALLHDIGDTLGTFNHPDVAAAILTPFVSEENLWMVKHHGIFQGYNFFHHLGMDRNLRDQFRDHPCYDRTEEFVRRYDNPAFDPSAKALSLDHFRPLLKRVMAEPRTSVYKAVVEPAESAPA